ncbi:MULTISPECIES: ABC transporter permease [unclassified Mesorhizobium]|uniref:ABC transporter permease n=1 Tax=unclassified Mesorhizobium TaxID=325217 RepID=UPI000FCAC3E8|nr:MULTISPECIES: ABC transporter permease [unclassified Mesorhizobium]RUW80432.1 ABC transporter permease [Mesorhizobium sp. M1E.F.Ca.ET.063.01.1.1]RWA76106.1 MAG: ABC transporter permease [Mesorhizobium sp.]TIS47441.1 MAG: ABC transporter permease subunit [Mesorhizobium sp.]
MLVYLCKRIGLSLIMILCAVLALFLLLHLIPGDPATIALGPRATPEAIARYAEKMHLDKPVSVQFGNFLLRVVSGNLGVDVFSNRSVTGIVLEALPSTLILAALSLLWAAMIGIPLGCISAVRPDSWFDRLTGVISVATIAIPSFLVSIWSLLIFAVILRWLPAIGAGEPGNLADEACHLVLPAFAVGVGWVGYLARMVRASMVEVLRETYIRAAYAFGLRRGTVVFQYALKVAILPTITLVGIGFGGLLSGATFAEIIFTRPGVGKLIYDMVMNRNFPVVQGAVLITTGVYVLINLGADLVVAWLDPRVRSSL